MKMTRCLCLAAVMSAALAGSLAHAQTAAEQLQKGIFTQETTGDLDGAITIYRQIVDSGSSPRDVAAQAQYRLAQALLQKGDLSNAAGEFEKLARNYADYGALVSNLANSARADMLLNLARMGSANTASGLTQDERTQQSDAAARALDQLRSAEEMLRREQDELKKRAAGAAAVPSGLAPPGTPQPPPDTVRVAGDVQEANLVSQAPINYPPLARAARVQGTVKFEATIGKDGHVENLQLRSGPPLLVQAAMESVRQWLYKPTLLNGQPVSVITTIDVNFTLPQ